MLNQELAAFSKKEEIFLANKFIDPKLKPINLQKSFSDLIKNNPVEEVLNEEVILKTVSLDEKIIYLKSFLQRRLKIAFQETIVNAKNKVEVVVTFLAVLEMIKRKTLLANQSAAFGEIFLEKKEIKSK